MRRLRLLGAVLFAVLLVGVLALGFLWGLDTSTQTDPVIVETLDYQLFSVEQISLGRSVPAQATVVWSSVLDVDVPAVGRLTRGLPASGVIEVGDVVIEVDGQPTIALEGPVPAYRTMRSGLVGDDVLQLQQFLHDLGFPVEPDGVFGGATDRAVSEWTESLGLERSSEVPLGRVVFASGLPWRVVPADALRLGAAIPQPTFLVVDPTPEVTAALLPAIASRVEQGADVVVGTSPEIHTQVLGPAAPSQDGSTNVLLDPTAFICVVGATCEIDINAAQRLPATVTMVPPTTGLAVPEFALQTDAKGQVVVTLADGTRQAVEAGPGADGLVIVTGLDEGVLIRVPLA